MRPTKAFETAAASTQAWWSCPGLLYFLAVGSPPAALKIGMLAVTPRTTVATAMERRLSTIQSSNHEVVYVLGLIHYKDGRHPTKDAEDAEREFHVRFGHLARFALGSRGAEWFNAGPELIAEIALVARPPEEFGVSRTVARPVLHR